jgi:fructose-bisphosphate aldolase class 1
MATPAMESTVAALIVSGKGILAADESFPTIEKRFKALNIESTEKNHHTYRELLFATLGLSEFISGVILFDETIPQRTKDVVLMPEVFTKQGIIPGIKVDKGTIALANFAGEKITQGIDRLRERLIEYRELRARFTKWRAVIAIGEPIPSRTCMEANAQALPGIVFLSGGQNDEVATQRLNAICMADDAPWRLSLIPTIDLAVAMRDLSVFAKEGKQASAIYQRSRPSATISEPTPMSGSMSRARFTRNGRRSENHESE